jgi:hypothetical protein
MGEKGGQDSIKKGEKQSIEQVKTVVKRWQGEMRGCQGEGQSRAALAAPTW